MSATSQDVRFSETLTGQQVADRVVRELLERASAEPDGELWASLASVLPLLAEASPESFLRIVDEDLASASPILPSLFIDGVGRGGAGYLFSSPHTHLLQALETLAWCPEYLASSALALGRLASRDPGGSLANRPINSLVSIFFTLRPQTSATLQLRMHVLDSLRRIVPDVAWDLLLRLIPSRHTLLVPNRRPARHDWGRELPMEVSDDWRSATQEIHRRLLEDARIHPIRWTDILDKFEYMPREFRDAAVQLLGCMDTAAIAEQDRQVFRGAIRRAVVRNRRSSTAVWALPADECAVLSELMSRFGPTDELEEMAALFAVSPETVQYRGNYEEYQREVRAGREAAIRSLYASGGLTRIEELARRTAYPSMVGGALRNLSSRVRRSGLDN